MTTEDHDETTNTKPTREEEKIAAGDGPIKHNVSWADGEPHYLGTSTVSTQTDCSMSTGTDQPLSPKFSEEGSSEAAVIDENHKILNNVIPTKPSTDIVVPEVRHKTNPSAQEGSSVSRVQAAEGSTLTLETTMGTKVVDAGDADVIPALSLESTRSGEEDDEVAALKEYTDEDAVAHGVLLSPSITDNLIDQVCLARSMSNDSDNDGLVPSSSDDTADAEVEGVILPPSMSPQRNKSPPATPTSDTGNNTNGGMKYIMVYTSYSATQLMSLPIDSLHCIASFLTPLEWAQYGQTCTAASKICREIFRRVRMHGFKCATEVISAWVSQSLRARLCNH
jgi:hypothetical protein